MSSARAKALHVDVLLYPSVRTEEAGVLTELVSPLCPEVVTVGVLTMSQSCSKHVCRLGMCRGSCQTAEACCHLGVAQ